MGYVHCNGDVYGIVPNRCILTSLICNLPLINLLYTQKITVHVTSRQRSGAPVTGVFGSFRIFKNQKNVLYRLKVPSHTGAFENLMTYMTIGHDEKRISRTKNYDYDVKFLPGNEYSLSLTREDP